MWCCVSFYVFSALGPSLLLSSQMRHLVAFVNIRIDCVTSLIPHWIFPVVPEFSDTFPGSVNSLGTRSSFPSDHRQQFDQLLPHKEDCPHASLCKSVLDTPTIHHIKVLVFLSTVLPPLSLFPAPIPVLSQDQLGSTVIANSPGISDISSIHFLLRHKSTQVNGSLHLDSG